MTDALADALLRAEIDTILADWAWHLDHHDYEAVAMLFTMQASFITGGVELRGREAIKNRYTERVTARSTRHTYSGLRIRPAAGYATRTVHGASGFSVEMPTAVRAWSTWVNYAVNATAPVDDVGVYLVADFEDHFVFSSGRWLISQRRIKPVFRDTSRAPA